MNKINYFWFQVTTAWYNAHHLATLFCHLEIYLAEIASPSPWGWGWISSLPPRALLV